MDGDMTARLLYLGLLIVAVGGYVFVEFRGRMGQALRQAAAWGLIIVGLMAGYGLWTDMRSTLVPRQSVVDANTIEIPRAPDGHYYVTLQIGDRDMTFMADTGATNIVIGRDTAESLGIDPDALVYLGTAQTANGIVRTARVTLEDVSLGPIQDARLNAYVTDGDMEGGLLGMDYLGRFRIEIAGDRMILTR
ncbi:retropepsin-like aspartic protease family protein [Szabonella alba]|uniref:TIGR02281 family clan AA aspartic protease n=1 Tax=Szabonella alba TaxID=2804194 RepID=A0A8K0Y0W5_9RHOB|nr:TIGR02281 family clan AA aspartic protease [Szabonella alba]MBL4917553.1 TIGR02281 family clan AA aspartic protease [Szabonella alba]